jgi:hypothetical protein
MGMAMDQFTGETPSPRNICVKREKGKGGKGKNKNSKS